MTPRSPKHNKLQAVLSSAGRWAKAHTRLLMIIGAVLLVLAAEFGLYKVAYSRGQKAQKKADEKLIADSRRSAPNLADQLKNRNIISVNGTVEAVSATEISVKQANGEVKKVKVDKDTTTTNSKNSKVEVTSLKKGDKVFISGTMENNTALAKRVRIVTPIKS